ncbi:hypothetical protein CWI84_02275 [Idiomarina tyrosinivorans]|uniref:Aminotransferase class V domain-containing protein n=1 Tax=Idiomarina tyrosinivorans TaxID=1445662 RepID=A0A432ZSZ8_9GAMM|nr:aminotransferase class V-fold PLP-dependent enzyme [Idiomarina tyrosinivorans]RUO80961.1 hypothetical protein CWI84_02275 [Idiomarina tyrosinivorans]
MDKVRVFDSLKEFKSDFDLDKAYSHLGLGIFNPQYKQLNKVLGKFREKLDRNPDLSRRYRHKLNENSRKAIGQYLQTSKDNIVLTESTTMGLSMVLNGFKFNRADEVLACNQDHYSVLANCHSLARTQRCSVKLIECLGENDVDLTKEELKARYIDAISNNTRLVVLTWVNSCFGHKIPVKEICDEIRMINRHRSHEQRIYVLVDAVHALGVENFDSIESLGADFVASGCHKWLFGPRGTGFLYGKDGALALLEPLVPSFEGECWNWFTDPKLDVHDWKNISSRDRCEPGGFRAYENQWALAHSFSQLTRIGKSAFTSHIYSLCQLAKHLLCSSDSIILHTPKSSAMSSGFVCFSLKGVCSKHVSHIFKDKGYMLGYTPYEKSTLRLAPSVLNSEDEVSKVCLELISFAERASCHV